MGPYIAYITTFAIGVLCVIIGIMNSKGDISTLHSYHRHRVTEEDRIPFGKRVGLGMMVIGAAIIAFSALSAVTVITGEEIYTIIATALLFLGLAVGLVIAFRAMIKYNKGIF